MGGKGSGGATLTDLTGRSIGKWTVLRLHCRGTGRVGAASHARWWCRCECGKETDVDACHLLAGKTSSCGCWHKARGPKSRLWRGAGEISGSMWRSIAGGATSRNLTLSVTIQDAWELFLLQDRKCALSGVRLVFRDHAGGKPATASLDRIDSALGYDPGNVQWVHKTINRIKMDLPESEFKAWCVAVAKHDRATRSKPTDPRQRHLIPNKDKKP